MAEWILAGVKALFSTSLDEEVFPYREELNIEIVRDSDHSSAPKFMEKPSIGSRIVIAHSGVLSQFIDTAGQNWFLHILAIILSRLVMIPNPDAYMKRIFVEESALARSGNFTESAITMANILGQNLKTRIPDWNIDQNPRAYLNERNPAIQSKDFDRFS